MKGMYLLPKSWKLCLLTVGIFFGILPAANAQLKLGNNPNTINASALLELESTTQGLLLTRLNTQQMNNITAPPAGLLLFNTDSGCVFIRQGAAWRNLCDAPSIDIMQFITSSPGMDSIIRIIADNANNHPLRDSIFNTVQLQGRDITSASPITVTGGMGASLRDVNISIDSMRLVPTGGLPGQVVAKDSSGKLIWQTVTITNNGDNWGVQVVNHNATLTGNGTATSPLGVDSSALAGIISHSSSRDTVVSIVTTSTVLRDTVLSIVSSQAHDIIGTSPITVIGGNGATLQDVTVSIDSNRILPTGGTPGQIVIRDSSNTTVWVDGSTLGDNWGTQVINHDATLTGNGTATSPLGVDSSALAGIISHSSSRDTVVSIVTTSTVLRDTVLSIVSSQAHDITGTSPITVVGGNGATLQDVTVSIDSTRILPTGGTPGQIVIRDSSNTSVWIDGSTLGDNWGTQSVNHDATLTGNGTATSPLGVDSSALAGIISHSSSRDTVISIVTTSTVLRDTVLSIVNSQAHDMTGTSPITVVGGNGATLQDVTVSIDSTRILPTGGTPGQIIIRDSSNTSVWVDGSTLGDDWGTQVVSHNGTLTGNGTATSPLGVDSSALAGIISHSSSRDTVIAIINASSGNLTAGNNLVSVAGGTGATLHNTSVTVNADSVAAAVVTKQVFKDSVIKVIAGNANQSPLRDSIFSTVTAQGKALTSTSPILTVTNGAKATLTNTAVNVDTTALINFLSHSTLIDSFYNFKGFNASGTTTSGSVLSLLLDVNNDPNTVSAYAQQRLADTTTFPSFNMGTFHNGSPSYFQAPITGYYSFSYSVSLVQNPSVLSLGGEFTWGIALIKTNGTPAIIQSSRRTQTLSASVLGVIGVATVESNDINTLVKLNAGDRVAVGVGAVSGVTLNLLGTATLRQRFSGYLVK